MNICREVWDKLNICSLLIQNLETLDEVCKYQIIPIVVCWTCPSMFNRLYLELGLTFLKLMHLWKGFAHFLQKPSQSRLRHMKWAITHSCLCTCLKLWRHAKKSMSCLIKKTSRCAADCTSKTTKFLIFHFL